MIEQLNIREAEAKVVKSRKEIIIDKIEMYYEYYCMEDGSYVFFDYLEANTSFKYGQVVEFDKFKKEFLTSFDNLKKFNDVYYNSGMDIDELLYFGFDGNLTVVSETEFYISVFDAIMAYEFTPLELYDFEQFVAEKFDKCCH